MAFWAICFMLDVISQKGVTLTVKSRQGRDYKTRTLHEEMRRSLFCHGSLKYFPLLISAGVKAFTCLEQDMKWYLKDQAYSQITQRVKLNSYSRVSAVKCLCGWKAWLAKCTQKLTKRGSPFMSVRGETCRFALIKYTKHLYRGLLFSSNNWS